MKRFLVFASLVGLASAAPVTAELAITSFNRNGQLTWTNSVTNGTYRIEWAGSVDGPWQSFDALTNLTRLASSTNSVTIAVPTFYRVVWVDPPPPQPTGTWQYRAFDYQGVLVVTGRLSLVYATNQDINLTGTRDLQWTGNPSPAPYFEQLGAGAIAGMLTDSGVFLDLNSGAWDSNTLLRGQMVGTEMTGTWSFNGFAGEMGGGRFSASKQSSGLLGSGMRRAGPEAAVPQPAHD